MESVVHNRRLQDDYLKNKWFESLQVKDPKTTQVYLADKENREKNRLCSSLKELRKERLSRLLREEHEGFGKKISGRTEDEEFGHFVIKEYLEVET